MNAKHVTAGSLHLGTTPNVDNEPTYGMSFNSRPSALKFWYKYVPRNSVDFGSVEIWIEDANGNIIVKKQNNITEHQNYTEFNEIHLEYPSNAAKAKTICIVFKSSINPDCLTATDANLTKPKFGNLSDGNYEGAIFTIDDIELIY